MTCPSRVPINQTMRTVMPLPPCLPVYSGFFLRFTPTLLGEVELDTASGKEVKRDWVADCRAYMDFFNKNQVGDGSVGFSQGLYSRSSRDVLCLVRFRVHSLCAVAGSVPAARHTCIAARPLRHFQGLRGLEGSGFRHLLDACVGQPLLATWCTTASH
jgi:hypothetical protein